METTEEWNSSDFPRKTATLRIDVFLPSTNLPSSSLFSITTDWKLLHYITETTWSLTNADSNNKGKRQRQSAHWLHLERPGMNSLPNHDKASSTERPDTLFREKHSLKRSFKEDSVLIQVRRGIGHMDDGVRMSNTDLQQHINTRN